MELSWRQRGLVERPLWFPAACSLFIITGRVILRCLVMSGYIFLDVNYNTACLTLVSSSPANCNWFSHCYYGAHCYTGESFFLHLPSPTLSHAPKTAKSFHYCVTGKVRWIKAAKGVCLTGKGQQVGLWTSVLGAWIELVSRKNWRWFASLCLQFILSGRSIEARGYGEFPATIACIFGARSGAEWSLMIPIKLFHLCVLAKQHLAEGTHRFKIRLHRAHKYRS